MKASGITSLHDLTGALFVRVVEERKQKADDHRIDAALFQKLGGLAHLALVQWHLDLAGRRRSDVR